MDIFIALQEYNKSIKGSWRVGDDYSSLEWLGDPLDKPSEILLQQCYNDFLQRKLNDAYKEQRVKEYPSVVDQLDLLYHVGYDGWKQVIKQIKDKYPKPE